MRSFLTIACAAIFAHPAAANSLVPRGDVTEVGIVHQTGQLKPGEAGRLHDCLKSYDNTNHADDNWDGMICGGTPYGWFIGHSHYDSRHTCYNLCSSKVSDAIDAGYSDVRCLVETYKNPAFATDRRCWFGYH